MGKSLGGRVVLNSRSRWARQLVLLALASGCTARQGFEVRLPADANAAADPEPRPLGAGCQAGVECASGACADGVCCDSICTGAPCQTCGPLSAAGVGTCGWVNSAAEDPRGDCTAGTSLADGCAAGTCSGAGYSCGIISSGDGGCPNCTTCADDDVACEPHAVGTQDGCDGAITCGGLAVRLQTVCDGAGGCAPRDESATDCAGTCASYCSAGACVDWDTAEGTCNYVDRGRLASGGDGSCVAGQCLLTPSAWLERDGVWKYLDDGSDQGTAWYAAAFDDSAWASGPATLGYGDGGEATVVGYGPNASDKYETTYFRAAFSVADPAAFVSVHLELRCDDGAVVYLNGVEVYRTNMPAGPIAYTTLAVANAAEPAPILVTTLDPTSLVAGVNVVAVEVHQASVSSSDLTFSLRAWGKRASDPTFVTYWQHEDWLAVLPGVSLQGTDTALSFAPPAVTRSSGRGAAHFTITATDPPATTQAAVVNSPYNYLGVVEGALVYFGWSDYYVTVPTHAYGVFSWRDQDPGFPGCSVIELDMWDVHAGLGTVNGLVVRIKEGQAPNGAGAIIRNIQSGLWYDFVVGMKYAKDASGFFTVWAAPAATGLAYANPVYSYSGPTMYALADIGAATEPCDNTETTDIFNTPQLRVGGANMWGEIAPFESYKGPLRINVGEQGAAAFAKVVPR